MLKALISELAVRPSSERVDNQYREPELRENLKIFLDYIAKHGSRLLVVGEAPGYRGCRLSGIPFTSGQVIETSPHSFFTECRHRLKLKQVAAEATATIFWGFLTDKELLPLMWNAFPFHPHQSGAPESNRKPEAAEIEEGLYCRLHSSSSFRM